MVNRSFIVATLIVAIMIMGNCYGKAVKFCMPPKATYWETSYATSYEQKYFEHVAEVKKIQHDESISRQRVDRIGPKGEIYQSEISILDENKNSVIYTIGSNGACSCTKFGPSDSGVHSQCIESPILEKGFMAGMNALRVGFNQSESIGKDHWNDQGIMDHNGRPLTQDSYHWIIPADKSGYWWFMSNTVYGVDAEGNVELFTKTFYNQQPMSDSNAFVIPKNCPVHSECPVPKGGSDDNNNNYY